MQAEFFSSSGRNLRKIQPRSVSQYSLNQIHYNFESRIVIKIRYNFESKIVIQIHSIFEGEIDTLFKMKHSHHTLHSNIKLGRNIVTLEAGWKESVDGIKLVVPCHGNQRWYATF